MSKENNVISDFDFSLIADFFRKMPRQGPGSDPQTAQAIEFLSELGEDSRIADLGCGTGTQTKVLADRLEGHVTAVDLLPELVEEGRRRLSDEISQGRVTIVQGSMDNLGFRPESLDVIWAEGSIYNIGFENGFRYWRQFLKPGGYIAVTDTCWRSEKRPEAMDKILTDHVEIGMISEKIAIIEQAGYEPISHFVLPEDCWTTEYYEPKKERIITFLEEHAGSPQAVALTNMLKGNLAYYYPILDTFSYVFFIARKPK